MALWDANAHQDEEESSSEEEVSSKKRKRGESSKAKKKRRKKSKGTESEHDSDEETVKEEESASDEDAGSSKKKKKKKGRRESDEHSGLELGVVEDFGGGHVYRAVRKETISLGWTQAPCGHCPQFTFCHEKGPVNPKGCEYYGGWLSSAIIDSK